MKLGKVENGKLVAIVDHPELDSRKDSSGEAIYRPVTEVIPELEDNQRLGKRYFKVEKERIIETFEVLTLSKKDVEALNRIKYLSDPNLPSIEDRVFALESGNTDAIASNKAAAEDLRKKYGIS